MATEDTHRRERFWCELVSMYHVRLRAYCRITCRCNPGDLDDIVWDAWHEALEHESVLLAARDRWRVLRRLACRSVSSRKRQWHREWPLTEEAAAYEPVDRMEAVEVDARRRAWADALLRQLSDKQRQAIDFRYRWGWPYVAIAAALETEEATARVHVARGLQRLRALAREGEFEDNRQPQ